MPESPLMYDGETRRVTSASGSAYDVKCVGGVYSCSCPGWRNQSRHPHYRTCKHLIDFRGPDDEAERIVAGGRSGMPATTLALLAGHWPGSGAGRRADVASGRVPAPVPSDRFGSPTPGGRAVGYTTTKTVRMGKVAAVVPDPKVSHNAWTAILDDEHPLAEPLPPPANDAARAEPESKDEPEWETDASAPIDPAKVVAAAAAAPAPVAFRGVLLAQEWDGVQNIAGWIMSEKLDGVRAYWDGTRFMSRNGNVFAVPDWYTEGLPKDVHLDGEFWMARGQFQKTSGFVRRADRGEHWRGISYMIFDAPTVEAGFEERLAHIASLKLPAHAKLLPHAACPSIDVLKTYLGLVEEQGGEGVMLRQPGSRYVRTRSGSLLKVKTFFDTEAEVTGTTAGKGRHDGSVGALESLVRETITLKAGKKTCTIKGGTRFEVGTGLVDAQRRPGAIPIGSIITFRFQELSTDGIPRFPSLIAVRDYE